MADAADEYERGKRLRKKSPTRIAARNKKKRSGLLSFEVSEDGKTLRIWNYRTLRGAERVALMIAAAGKGTLFDTKSGGLLAQFTVAKPDVALGMLKLTPVPEACARCEGSGQISNPLPKPEHPTHDWMNETTAEFEARRDAMLTAYEEKHGKGSWWEWNHLVRCPSCRGTGRAVQLESEDA